METLGRALRDPELRGLDLIIPETAGKAAGKVPQGAYVSEWLYEGAGPLHYRYHVHNPQMGRVLKALLRRGLTSGRPKLTDVYTSEELTAMAGQA